MWTGINAATGLRRAGSTPQLMAAYKRRKQKRFADSARRMVTSSLPAPWPHEPTRSSAATGSCSRYRAAGAARSHHRLLRYAAPAASRVFASNSSPSASTSNSPGGASAGAEPFGEPDALDDVAGRGGPTGYEHAFPAGGGLDVEARAAHALHPFTVGTGRPVAGEYNPDPCLGHFARDFTDRGPIDGICEQHRDTW